MIDASSRPRGRVVPQLSRTESATCDAMTFPDLLIASFTIAQVIWFFAIGASVGSLINVIVYRLPLGLSIVSPPSRCPACETRLTWRENIPVFGWLSLGGKCRFCRSRISPEYPLVELAVGLLFALLFTLWYLVPPTFQWLGVPFGQIAPEWAGPSRGYELPLLSTWPMLLQVLVLMGCLVAMTLIDARTFTIPLVLTWIPAILAIVVHPLHALWLQLTARGLPHAAPGWVWLIPTPGPMAWYWVGFSIAGALGLGVSLLLLRAGLITRSFADYEQWEEQAIARREAARSADPAEPPSDAAAPSVDPDAPLSSDEQADLWVQYPHARREMIKELAFLTPPVVLALIGGWGATRLIARTSGWEFDPGLQRFITDATVPLWLSALCGALLGYLIGGGVVWAIRVAGSLAFGKEAVGLGDVHLMAAVGACLGWIDSILAFFLAAFVGLAWAILASLFRGLQRQLPFGPHLAVACLLVLLLKPLLELGLSRLAQAPVVLP